MSVFEHKKMSSKAPNRRASTSILKKGSSVKPKLKTVSSNSAGGKVRFVLPHSQNVRNILVDFIQNGNRKDYENLVCLIRDSELTDNDIYLLLKEATECISLLNQDLRFFVEALLSVKWIDRDENLVTEYQSFLVNLISAHNYHAKFVIENLVQKFIPPPLEAEWPDGIPSDSDCLKCVNLHKALNILLNIVPMCRELLLHSLISQFPYFKKETHTNEFYLFNLLWITEYQASLRPDILHLIISKLIIMDVHAPREEIEKAQCCEDEDIFEMDEAATLKTTKLIQDGPLEISHTLDVCLNRLFNFFLDECHEDGELNFEKTKSLYHEMLSVFENVILPTYNIHHVQFCMFVLCSFKPTIAEAFLNFLWKKVCDPSVAAILRQSAIGYIASLIARATYVPLIMLKGTLQQISAWLHAYIAQQDGLECVNSDVRVHSVFYSVCQALFYAVTFRHKDLVSTKKNMVFLESLNLAKMVTCRLNPLRVCQPAVVQNFAAVTRKYQLAYCYSVIEHNSRNVIPTIYQDEKGCVQMSNNVLDAFYPFDPFILERSSKNIHPFYREYQESNEENSSPVKEVKESGEVDDFLETHAEMCVSPKNNDQFSYATSPGFKFLN